MSTILKKFSITRIHSGGFSFQMKRNEVTFVIVLLAACKLGFILHGRRDQVPPAENPSSRELKG